MGANEARAHLHILSKGIFNASVQKEGKWKLQNEV